MQTPEVEANQDMRETLESILEQYRNRWQRYIAGILKNETEAEDVVHDAVRRVLLRNLSFSSEDQARMYLGRTIGNVAFERYKGMKRERRRQMPVEEHLIVPSGNISPYDWLELAEEATEKERMLRLVRRGLQLLPSKQYEALRLTILDSCGSSIRDAGMNHGIPYSTLRHRSRQGLRSLRRFLLARRGIKKKKTEFRIQNSE